MPITKRVTARYHSRRAARAPGASPLREQRQKSDVRDGFDEQKDRPTAHTDLVAECADLHQPMSLSPNLGHIRARAEQILRRHPRGGGLTDPSCEICLVQYPCDAVQAAQDVIAITKT
jgi:hypothetical protein